MTLSDITDVPIIDENLSSYFGTKLYCAPEVLNCDKSYDYRVDLYSLGLIVFEMWHPFKTVMERCKMFSDIKSSTVKIPDSLEPKIIKEVMSGLLQHDPKDRMVLDEVIKNHSLINVLLSKLPNNLIYTPESQLET